MELGGNQIQIYKQSMDDKFNEKTPIRNKLDSALKNNELQVFYQPIHNLSGKQVVAVESAWSFEINNRLLTLVSVSPAERIRTNPLEAVVAKLVEVVEIPTHKEIARPMRVRSTQNAVGRNDVKYMVSVIQFVENVAFENIIRKW